DGGGRRVARGGVRQNRRGRRRTVDLRGRRALGRREPVGAAVLHRHAPAGGGAGGRGLHVRVRGGGGRRASRGGGRRQGRQRHGWSRRHTPGARGRTRR